MKSVLVSTVFVASTLALAAGGTTEVGGKGRGWMVSNNNRRVRFEIEVRKVTREGKSEVGGKANFRSEYRDGEQNIVVELGMPKCQRFGKNGNVAEFGGEAVYHRNVNKKPGDRIQGNLVVVATDRKEPGQREKPQDMIRFRFTPKSGGSPIEIAGEVIDGDVSVYEKTR